MAFAKCVKAKDVLGSTAQREVYVKMRATCDWISTSGCESSWTSRLCSWEDSSNMTRYRQSCLRLSSWATWAQGLQAFRFPANISNRRSTAGAVRESKSSTTDAGAWAWTMSSIICGLDDKFTRTFKAWTCNASKLTTSRESKSVTDSFSKCWCLSVTERFVSSRRAASWRSEFTGDISISSSTCGT